MQITVVNIKKDGKIGHYVGRPSCLGNPFSHLKDSVAEFHVATRDDAVEQYRGWIQKRLADDERIINAFNHLTSQLERDGELILSCWCKPAKCHGDVLKELLLSQFNETRIDRFFGKHRFLSNFYELPQKIEYDGVEYTNTECAYQASKYLRIETRQQFAALPAKEAYQLKKRLRIERPNWEQDKFAVMLDLLRLKFAIPELRTMLIATGNKELIEGNTWGDTCWGVCNGRGDNNLGKLLMKVRSECISKI